MTFIEQYHFLMRLDRCIAGKRTGTAQELASFMDSSRSTIFINLDTLRSLGGEIDYCKFRKTYYYVDNKRPRFAILSPSNSEKYYGGKTFFNFFLDSPRFLDWGVSPLYQVHQQEENQWASDCASFLL
jgi:hypothetical protein